MKAKHMRTTTVRIGLFLALCAGIGAAAQSKPAATEIKIDNFSFTPAEVKVPVGATVVWTNRDDIPHALISTGKVFKSKVLDTGDRFSFTFAKAGQFGYFCSLHPHMTGTIIVKA